MRKIFFIFICFLFLGVQANTLKGGVTQEYIPEGFFGSWGVISKLNSSNNPNIFNYESRDIWMLSGHDNILILENLESGAKSEIEIKTKSLDGKTLKFSHMREEIKNNKKIIYKETVQFTLLGNNFSGTDDYIIERYNENNDIIKKDIANYSVAGVRFIDN